MRRVQLATIVLFFPSLPSCLPCQGLRCTVGIATDVMNRAAVRAGLKLEWVVSDRSPEATFEAGTADLSIPQTEPKW